MKEQRCPNVQMNKQKDHIPIRTCIACRTKKAKKEFLRLVLDGEGWVIVDSTGHAPGRGAYICKSKECWNALRKQKILARAFRGAGRFSVRPDLAEKLPGAIKE